MKGRKSSGEQRAPGEKGSRLIDPMVAARRAAEAEEEARWASLAGPVTVRRKGDEEGDEDEESVTESRPTLPRGNGPSATYKSA